MSDSVQVSLWRVIFRLPVALKIQLAIVFAVCCGALFSMGMYLGAELNRYIVGYKEIELFMVRNELAEARRTLEVISAPLAEPGMASAPVGDGEKPAAEAESVAVVADGPVAAGYRCVSQQLALLGLYAGEPVTSLTPDLQAASEKYRNYMRTLEADWHQPALDDVMVGHWCDRAAAAFSNLQPYFDDYKLAIAR